MPNSYIQKIDQYFQRYNNPQNAPAMSKYMRNRFPYLGIKSPQRKELFKSFLAENGLPSKEDLEEVVKGLWNLPEREFQYIAIDLVGKWAKKLEEKDLELLEYHDSS